MEFSYGRGIYVEGSKRMTGTIVLGAHKLFLKGQEGDIISTYIPLDKIAKIEKKSKRLSVFVQLSLAYLYMATIEGEKKYIDELTNDLVKRRQLKKQFLKNEWREQEN